MMCACVCVYVHACAEKDTLGLMYVCVRLCPINGFNVAENEIYYEFSPFKMD